jgi:hypothetical protein
MEMSVKRKEFWSPYVSLYFIIYVLNFSRAINHLNIALITIVSENFSASIIRIDP